MKIAIGQIENRKSTTPRVSERLSRQSINHTGKAAPRPKAEHKDHTRDRVTLIDLCANPTFIVKTLHNQEQKNGLPSSFRSLPRRPLGAWWEFEGRLLQTEGLHQSGEAGTLGDCHEGSDMAAAESGEAPWEQILDSAASAVHLWCERFPISLKDANKISHSCIVDKTCVLKWQKHFTILF